MLPRIFLSLMSVTLLGIGGVYAFSPLWGMATFYGFTVDATPASIHVFRTVGGWFLASALFWAVSAIRQQHVAAALWSVVLLMFGLASGRVLSLALDGGPHPLQIFFLIVEPLGGLLALGLLHRLNAATPSNQVTS